MSFSWDSTGIDPDNLLPEGKWFPFKILEAEEKVSKKSGYNMVVVKAAVFNDERYNSMTVLHYVTFIPKGLPGEGINVHFRKCIGVPYGGLDDVDADDWVGKKFMGKIKHEDYEGGKNHKISAVSPMPDDIADERQAALKAQAPTNKDEDIPF